MPTPTPTPGAQEAEGPGGGANRNSVGILSLPGGQVTTVEQIGSFRMPEESSTWLGMHKGTGCLLEITRNQGPWLQPGDQVALEIQCLGILANQVEPVSSQNGAL